MYSVKMGGCTCTVIYLWSLASVPFIIVCTFPDIRTIPRYLLYYDKLTAMHWSF